MSIFQSMKDLRQTKNLAQALALGLGLTTAMAAKSQEEQPLPPPHPTITCESDPAVFNTGVNLDRTGVLQDDWFDNGWEVTDMQVKADPIPTAPPDEAAEAWYSALIGRTTSDWSASPATNAQWISREGGQSDSGDWYYRYRFFLDPSVDASRYTLNLDFMVDNSVAEIYVNGIPQHPNLSGLLPQGGGAYDYGGFHSADQVSLSHNWQTGMNDLVVLVHSDGPYEGFLAYASDEQPVCHPAPRPTSVPTLSQWSMLLLALMLGLLAWRSWRAGPPRA